MSTVLVTGGGGFIGKGVVRELLSKGHKVKIYDLKKPGIEEVERSYEASVLDPYLLSRAMRGCDHVVHLAASLGVSNTEINRSECLFINIQGTVNVLEACVKEGVKKVVFSSSSEVYGEQRVLPITEEAPLNPKSNYAITKMAGEEYFRAYKDAYGINYNIVRFFNVYGEGQRDDFVMSKFVKNALSERAPEVYGDGNQVRCFCNVKDAARGLVAALFSETSGEVFNIGNDREPINMKNLALRVIDITGKSIAPKMVPYHRSDRDEGRDIMQRIPSIEKAKKVLGYEPRIPLAEGLKEIVNFYRGHQEMPELVSGLRKSGF